jgi:hypothetical protein
MSCFVFLGSLEACVQEKLFLGPVVKKEFHFQPKNASQGMSANLTCTCEWDTAQFKVLSAFDLQVGIEMTRC